MLLKWALVFFILALVAAMFGFSGIAVAAAGIAQILFFFFVGVFLALLTVALLTLRSKAAS